MQEDTPRPTTEDKLIINIPRRRKREATRGVPRARRDRDTKSRQRKRKIESYRLFGLEKMALLGGAKLAKNGAL